MGIFCEINLFKPIDGAFRPGSIITGVIKYAVDEETKFTKIVMALKGQGYLRIQKREGTKQQDTYNYYRTETYVDVENVLTGDEKEMIAPIGSYETQFNYELPHDIPQTFGFCKQLGPCHVICKITYGICIKFERRGLFKLNKTYKKEIDVVTGILPTLPTEPCILGERKTLTQFFTRKKSIVDIKATIENSVSVPGGKINFNYELTNDTNVTISDVKMKLVETHKFFLADMEPEIGIHEKVKNTDSKTGSVQSGAKKTMDIEIAVPSSVVGSLQHSKLVSREYGVHVTVTLPFPHRNLVLQIPVQIGTLAEGIASDGTEPPPSYWEAMGEDDEKEEK